jgi:hypothetical protein
MNHLANLRNGKFFDGTTIDRIKQSRLGGLGGGALSFSGRLKSLTVGRFQMHDLIARFSRGRRGDNASAAYDGLNGDSSF